MQYKIIVVILLQKKYTYIYKIKSLKKFLICKIQELVKITIGYYIMKTYIIFKNTRRDFELFILK